MAYAEQRLASRTRKPTPVTRTALRYYQAACLAYLDAVYDFDWYYLSDLQEEIRDYVVVMNNQYYMQVEKKPDIESLKHQIIEARKVSLLARYGDYFALVCHKLRTEAEISPSAHLAALRSHSNWMEIAERARKDIARMVRPQFLKTGPWLDWEWQELPMLTAIGDAAEKAGLEFEPALYAVTKHGERTVLVHRSFKNMMKTGDYNQLAEALFHDLTDIPTLFDDRETHTRTLLTAIVENIIDRWFVRESNPPTNPQS